MAIFSLCHSYVVDAIIVDESIKVKICGYGLAWAGQGGRLPKPSGGSLTNFQNPYIMPQKTPTTNSCPTHSGRERSEPSISLLVMEDSSGSGYAL